MEEKFSALKKLKFNGEISGSHSPYILCNEEKQQETLQTLHDYSSKLGGEKAATIHLGFSVWFNLDLLATIPVDYSIVLDIDPKVQGIYDKIIAAIAASDEPSSFIKNFMASFTEDDVLLQFPKEYQQKELEKLLNLKYGFLSSNASYLAVKKMVSEGRIFFGKADMTSVEDMTLISTFCKERSLKITTLYLSNIPEWIMTNATLRQQENLLSSLDLLKDPETQVISASYNGNRKTLSGPPQHILPSSELLKFTSSDGKMKRKAEEKMKRKTEHPIRKPRGLELPSTRQPQSPHRVQSPLATLSNFWPSPPKVKRKRKLFLEESKNDQENNTNLQNIQPVDKAHKTLFTSEMGSR